MIIGTCGFTGTGSSAVSDYIKEFSSVSALDGFEFNVTHAADGIEDLDFQINNHCAKYMSSAVAIERFRSNVYNFLIMGIKDHTQRAEIIKLMEDYISSIIQVRWKGYGAADFQIKGLTGYKRPKINMLPYRISRKLLTLYTGSFKKQCLLYPAHEMNFSMKPEQFLESTKKFIENLLKAYGADYEKKILLDQPFSATNPYLSFKYFDDPVAIIVDRDPRDLFLCSKRYYRIHGAGYQIPTDDVKSFILYYKTMRDVMHKNLSEHNDKQVMFIQFEDMVYDFENTRKKINNFCGLQESERVGHYFEPSLSIANTQLIRRYPDEEKNIKIIERELPEYLYRFDEYGDVDIKGSMFFNRSPLNV